MGLQSHLKNWVNAEIISDDQASLISEYQKQKNLKKFQSGVKYSAYFAIVLGVILLIASNWDMIGVHAKLIIHGAVNFGLAYVLWIWRLNDNRKGLRDAALYLFCGFTLSFLSLIGQSFQLQGDIGGLIALWIALITGLVIIMGTHQKLFLIWIAGFTGAIFLNIEKIMAFFPDNISFYVLLCMHIFIPLGLWGFAYFLNVKNINRPFSKSLRYASLVALIFGGLSASSVFYIGVYDLMDEFSITSKMHLLSVIGLIGSFAYLTCFILHKTLIHKADIKVFIIAISFIILPWFIAIESAVLACIYFILFCFIMAWISAKNNNSYALNLFIAMIGLRLFIGFVELFGTMLATGFGFIIAGVIVLLLVKAMKIFKVKIMEHSHAS